MGIPVREPNRGADTYLIGSCKFRNEPVDLDELELIEHYAHVFSKQADFHYMIFSLAGFTDRLKEAAD